MAVAAAPPILAAVATRYRYGWRNSLSGGARSGRVRGYSACDDSAGGGGRRPAAVESLEARLAMLGLAHGRVPGVVGQEPLERAEQVRLALGAPGGPRGQRRPGLLQRLRGPRGPRRPAALLGRRGCQAGGYLRRDALSGELVTEVACFYSCGRRVRLTKGKIVVDSSVI